MLLIVSDALQPFEGSSSHSVTVRCEVFNPRSPLTPEKVQKGRWSLHTGMQMSSEHLLCTLKWTIAARRFSHTWISMTPGFVAPQEQLPPERSAPPPISLQDVAHNPFLLDNKATDLLFSSFFTGATSPACFFIDCSASHCAADMHSQKSGCIKHTEEFLLKTS